MDHSVGPDRHSTWICQIKLAKDNLVTPDLTKKILEDVNCQLLPRTPPVAKAEWSEAGIVTNWMAHPIDNAEYRAESTVGDVRLAPIFHLEIGDIKRTPREAGSAAIAIRPLLHSQPKYAPHLPCESTTT